MSTQLCVIMDPIESIHFKKDTTLALLLEAQNRDWQIFYLELPDLFLKDNQVQGNIAQIQVQNDPNQWVTFLTSAEKMSLKDFDVVLMRKDPPVDLTYLYATHLLELAQAQGALVINNPRSLRDVNEKLFTAWFPDCCPPTLVSANINLLREFLQEQHIIVIKPLNSMGGQGVFVLAHNDVNVNSSLETLTHNGQFPIMAQKFLRQIKKGDKRILMVEGKPYPFALSRIPAANDIRGNLAHGAKGVGAELTERDLWLCEQVGPTLKEKGLFFVGLDVIGDYITEINVTSPTCVREIEAAFEVNICGQIIDSLSKKISLRSGESHNPPNSSIT